MLNTVSYLCFSLVETLAMEHNLFTGTVPTECSALVELKEFSIHRNDFTGTMPGGLCPGIAFAMVELKADCEEISCQCCTDCHVDPESEITNQAPPNLDVDNIDSDGIITTKPPPASNGDVGGTLPKDPSECKFRVKAKEDCYARDIDDQIIIDYTICNVTDADWLALYVSNGNGSDNVALFAVRVCQDDDQDGIPPCAKYTDDPVEDVDGTTVVRKGSWTLPIDDQRFSTSDEFKVFLNRGADSLVGSKMFQIKKDCSDEG
jgi:hypothetical protein